MPKRQPRQLEATKRFIRNFLRINNSREFLVFLFFLLVAFIFWYLTTMTGEYEMTYSPKLRLKNVPDGVLVVEPLPEQLDIVLKDKGDKLVEYKARGKFKELVIDYRHYANTQGHTAIYGKELDKLIASHLSSSTQVVSMSLDTLQYYVTPSHGIKVRYVSRDVSRRAGNTGSIALAWYLIVLPCMQPHLTPIRSRRYTRPRYIMWDSPTQ